MSRRLPAWLALSIVTIVAGGATNARAQSVPVKPYVLFILDTSGSMDNNTAFGPASCAGATAKKIDHAKCAIQNVANNYGDMTMALARFRQAQVDDTCRSACMQQAASACDGVNNDGDAMELIVPIVDNNQPQLASWDSFSCSGCGTGATDPELYAPTNANTPLEGVLNGAKRYWSGLDSPTQGPYWTGAGADPIRNDPLKSVFTSPGNQCRPYITILMTDGDETCNGTPNNGAASLLTTTVDGNNYHIVTKVIGFGKAPGYAPLEGIAHAGGTPDQGLCSTKNATACTTNANCTAPALCDVAAGVCATPTTTHCTQDTDCTSPQVCNLSALNEAYYAQNQEELELAINQIVAGAIKFEQCNGLDDDCDGAIDEDFDVGAACHDNGVGICQGTGVKVCTADGTGTTCQITTPGQPPGTEVCNGLDDDCDGLIDEGNVCAGCTGVELCNNIDDDCDGVIDEDLTRPCGTDVGDCVAGTETCVAGQWVGCTAIGPTPEVCDGHDNNCDGVIDGEAQSCYDGPPGTDGVGVCHHGTQVCTNGAEGACIGETLPTAEACDGLDNDCDGTVDEDTGGADCSSSCGIGTTVCQNGQIVCNSVPSGNDDNCNGIDDDCDGSIDEGAPPGGPCSTAQVCNGQLVCMNGGYVCVGQSAQPELCNCLDDDCDNQIDEDSPCPGGLSCVHPGTAGYPCQCAQACQPGEFPCPQGRVCVDGFCLVDPCANVTCNPLPNGDLQECQLGTCVRTCDQVTCPQGFVCYGPTGNCEPDDCRTFPDRCTADQLCVGGQCVANTCANVPCPTGQYCGGGACHGTCAGVDCPAGESCQLGACVADPCGQVCPINTYCDPSTGECAPSMCPNQQCQTGDWCNPGTGQCEQDPCLGVQCPGANEICYRGSCYDPSQIQPPSPDAGTGELITAAGGGGCDAGAGGGAGGLFAIAIGVVFATRRRRGKEVRS